MLDQSQNYGRAVMETNSLIHKGVQELIVQERIVMDSGVCAQRKIIYWRLAFTAITFWRPGVLRYLYEFPIIISLKSRFGACRQRRVRCSP